MTVVLFAVGSPLVVDAEEACERAGIRVVAAIRNRSGPAYVSDATRVVPVEELDDTLRRYPVVVALFTPGHRKVAFEEALALGFPGAATVIHPSSPVARTATLGTGVFINAGAVIGGACEIGDMVLINRSASVGHHTRIDAYASLGPGALLCGSVVVGRGAVIGAGAVIGPEVVIGANAVVGPGSLIRESVPAGALAVGNPCRILTPAQPGFHGLVV